MMGLVKRYRDLDLLAAKWPFITGLYANVVHHGIAHGEQCIHNPRGSFKRSRRSGARRSIDFDIGGELLRVGTWAVESIGGPEVRPTSESRGKT
jgi:hypothetical protein